MEYYFIEKRRTNELLTNILPELEGRIDFLKQIQQNNEVKERIRDIEGYCREIKCILGIEENKHVPTKCFFSIKEIAKEIENGTINDSFYIDNNILHINSNWIQQFTDIILREKEKNRDAENEKQKILNKKIEEKFEEIYGK